MPASATPGATGRDPSAPTAESAGRKPAIGIGLLLGMTLVLAGCGAGSGESAGPEIAAGSSSSATTSSVTTDNRASVEVVPTSSTVVALPTPAPAPAPVSSAAATTASSTGSSGFTTPLPQQDPISSSSLPARSSSSSTTESTNGLDCTVACNLVFEGDSLFHSFVDTICARLGTLNCVNSGISGDRVDQMVTTARTDVDLHAGGGGNDVLVLWGGTNDLWHGHHSLDPTENADKTYAWITTYVAERRAKGWDYIFVMTLPPSDPALVQGDSRLNDLIRQNAAGADAIIDLAGEPRLANPFEPILKTPDGVHYTGPGRELVLNDYLVPAIRGLNGS